MFIRAAARFLFAACLAASVVPARAAVHFDEARKVFRLDSPGVTYAFGVNERGELQPLYWGPALLPADPIGPAKSDPGVASQDPSTSTTPQEFAGWGQGLYTEPALKITFPDGNRDLVLHYVSHKIDDQTLAVLLKDIERSVFVTLRYQIDPDTGIIGRSALIENRGTVRIVVNSASAATWTLPRSSDYSLRYLAGRWGGEFLLHQQHIQPGETVLGGEFVRFAGGKGAMSTGGGASGGGKDAYNFVNIASIQFHRVAE
jgi:alpha-galactosidase